MIYLTRDDDEVSPVMLWLGRPAKHAGHWASNGAATLMLRAPFRAAVMPEEEIRARLIRNYNLKPGEIARLNR